MDIKDVATEQLIKNFPMLGSLLESVSLTVKGERSYNSATGAVTTTDTTESFKALVTRATTGSGYDAYPIASIVDMPFKTGDCKIIVPFSYIAGSPKPDDTIFRSKNSIVYRIFGVYNISDIAYMLYIRSTLDETG